MKMFPGTAPSRSYTIKPHVRGTSRPSGRLLRSSYVHQSQGVCELRRQHARFESPPLADLHASAITTGHMRRAPVANLYSIGSKNRGASESALPLPLSLQLPSPRWEVVRV